MSLHTAMASGASQGPNHLGTAVDHAQGSLHNADVAGGGEDTVLGGIPDEAAMPPPQAGASEALDPQGSVNAPSHGVPALIYDYRCAGSEAYIALAREVISRLPSLAEAA